jgi:arylformamidase
MIAEISHRGRNYKVDLAKPLDISMPLKADDSCARAWYVEPMRLEPVRAEGWVGDVNQGGSVNFRNILFNPHGNGTHTECVGHISKEFYTINKCLRRFFFTAELITVRPEHAMGDYVITEKQIDKALDHLVVPEALVIRTQPNGAEKLIRNYSHTNPPYIHRDAIKLMNEKGILHLLLDLPSVDREQDEGKLAAHKEFWHYPGKADLEKTITEMIYVPDEILDGTYLLNLQIAPFENDASPSKPVLYKAL